MTWSFLTQWSLRKVSRTKTELAKKSKKTPKKRRLLGLFCTLRNQSIVSETPFRRYELGRGAKYFSKRNIASMESDSGSLSDLLVYHSMILRRPIPAMNWLDSPMPLTRQEPFHQRNISVKQQQRAFCPTCHNVVIPVPQKRSNSYLLSNDQEYVTCAKRRRSCAGGDVSPSPAKLPCWQSPTTNPSNVGQYNPIYESVPWDNESSIYSEVADSSISPSNSCTEVDSSFETNATMWNTFDDDCSTYVSDLAHGAFSYQSEKSILGDPWVTSTFKRHQGVHTIYDEVASDTEETTHNGLQLVVNPVCQWDRSRQMAYSPMKQPNQRLKRARREYFICEE